MKEFNERAVAELLPRIAGPLSYHSRLEDLCDDSDYTDAAVKVARHLFWLDEDRAWPWVMTRYVEGLAYSSPLREGLLEAAAQWRPHLGERGRRRLRVLEAAETYWWRSNELEARCNLLEEDDRRGWLVDPLIEVDRHGEERQAIRLWAAANSWNHAGRLVEALETLRMSHQRIRDLDSGFGGRIADLSLSIAYEFYFSKKDYEKLRDSCWIAVESDPHNFRAWRELGTAYAWLKDYEKAIEYHRKALDLNPQDHDAWRSLGNDYLWLKDYEQAIEYHRKALDLNPQDHGAWRQLGIGFLWLKDYEKAIEYHRKALDLNPKDHAAWSNLGYIHMTHGERQLAVQKFERSLSEERNFPNAYSLWGDLLYRDDDWERAAEKYREAMTIDHHYLRSLLSLLALNRLLGLPDERSLWDETRSLAEREKDSSLQAEWLALNSEADRSLEKLAEAIQTTPDVAVHARFRPAFHILRSDTRFVEMTADAPGSTWNDFPKPRSSG